MFLRSSLSLETLLFAKQIVEFVQGRTNIGLFLSGMVWRCWIDLAAASYVCSTVSGMPPGDGVRSDVLGHQSWRRVQQSGFAWSGGWDWRGVSR